MSREIQFKQPIERVRPKQDVHLHWAYQKGPAQLRGVTRAISLCGTKDLPRAKVTSFPEEATCKECTRRANAQQS